MICDTFAASSPCPPIASTSAVVERPPPASTIASSLPPSIR
jgi:hypothetical protein